MVFNSTFTVILLIGVVVWLGVLTVMLLRMMAHYNRLTRGMTKATLKEVLDAILRTLTTVRSNTEKLDTTVRRLDEDQTYHIQRVGIVRFNPFADTGGAQSFSIALLDKQKNGLVMTSLYARSGNRWYIKNVVAGKGKELSLSKEEEVAVQDAGYIGKKII